MTETTETEVDDNSTVATPNDELATGSGTAPSPAKKAPAAKAPAKKAAKKVAKKANKKTAKKAPKKASPGSGPTPKYPRHSLEKALRVPRALIDQNAGKPATREEAIRFAGGKGTGLSGPWGVELSSRQKYGFLTLDNGTLTLTDRARRAISPQSDTDRLSALREAILDAPDFSNVYDFYRGEVIPDAPYYTNALTDRFKIPVDKVPEFQQLFDESVRFAGLLDDSGPQPRVLDVGRSVSSSGSGGPGAITRGTGKGPSGENCFVMQPFAGALGGYYETIFKPAITQAGLTPLRADADIFATGKIMDQIWRGINDATVLVAELTSKNPNVFYELGLAHALRKPVVLVSSNEEDVPFDLRHIRVIVYDQTDPFWGQKLINKIEDNIRIAIENPEDAIFHIEDVR